MNPANNEWALPQDYPTPPEISKTANYLEGDLFGRCVRPDSDRGNDHTVRPQAALVRSNLECLCPRGGRLKTSYLDGVAVLDAQLEKRMHNVALPFGLSTVAAAKGSRQAGAHDALHGSTDSSGHRIRTSSQTDA